MSYEKGEGIMDIPEIEEKIDILSYVVNTLDTNISYLESLSLENSRYNLYIAQMTEMCSNFENEINELREDVEF